MSLEESPALRYYATLRCIDYLISGWYSPIHSLRVSEGLRRFVCVPLSSFRLGRMVKELIMIRKILPFVAWLALLSASLIAQTFRGGVSGTVNDASGAAVAGANVKLVSPDTGLTRESVTSSTGEFVFQDLQL